MKNPIKLKRAELLEPFSLEWCIITIGAMDCQKDIAKTIVDKRVDYLLAVKGNQPSCRQRLGATLDHRLPKSYKKPAIVYFEKGKVNRDRREIRRCWVKQSLGKLDLSCEWEDLKSITMLESERAVGEKIH